MNDALVQYASLAISGSLLFYLTYGYLSCRKVAGKMGDFCRSYERIPVADFTPDIEERRLSGQ